MILAYFLGEDLGELVRSEILPPRQRTVLCSHLSLAELFYVLCRRKGQAMAAEYTRTFLNARYASIPSSEALDMAAAAYKCERQVSLADCYVLAVAKLERAAAVFAKKEREMVNEMRRRPFDVQIVFLEDYVK